MREEQQSINFYLFFCFILILNANNYIFSVRFLVLTNLLDCDKMFL